MSRWCLIVALFAMSSAWSQPAPDTSGTNPTAPAAADGACANNETKSGDTTQSATELQQDQRDLIERLSSSNDPRKLLAAALSADTLELSTNTHAPTSLTAEALLIRAQQVGPSDPQVWWISAMKETGDGLNHSHEQAIQRLIQIVPDNAAVWLLELDRANRAEDPIAGRLAIEHAARAKYFDDYVMAIASTQLRADTSSPTHRADATDVSDLSKASVQRAKDMAVGFGMSLTFANQSYLPLMRYCDPKLMAPADTQLRLDCVATGKLMGDSASSLISTVIGLRLQHRLANNQAETAMLEQQRRNIDWLLYSSSKAISIVPSDRQAQLVLDGQGEIERTKTLVSEAGLPLEPPADWKSSRETQAEAPATTE